MKINTLEDNLRNIEESYENVSSENKTLIEQLYQHKNNKKVKLISKETQISGPDIVNKRIQTLSPTLSNASTQVVLQKRHVKETQTGVCNISKHTQVEYRIMMDQSIQTDIKQAAGRMVFWLPDLLLFGYQTSYLSVTRPFIFQLSCFLSFDYQTFYFSITRPFKSSNYQTSYLQQPYLYFFVTIPSDNLKKKFFLL